MEDRIGISPKIRFVANDETKCIVNIYLKNKNDLNPNRNFSTDILIS
jgi:hypothetical protein